MSSVRRIAVTGSDGFIGKNLVLRLSELDGFVALPLPRSADQQDWQVAMTEADFVVHLAGVNRPEKAADFSGNMESVKRLVDAMAAAGRYAPVILSSSAKAGDDSDYGRSKLSAENLMLAHAEQEGFAAAIYRLPNVFGKWCKPNYNSAVATFCHNVARGLPITVNDPLAPIELVYIDDVISSFLGRIDGGFESGRYEVTPTYNTTVGWLAETIEGFQADRQASRVIDVGIGITRALYATYISYLPTNCFSYPLKAHADPRGVFAEMLHTRDAGQFSYFTCNPGKTRGGHYHHTKTEKFLVVQGEALFRFRHMLTGETHSIRTSGEKPLVVETIPGWTHDVTNVGEDVMISILWANEIFDRDKPDTIAQPV